MDIGASHNSGWVADSSVRKPVGFYCNLGLGYQYRINKRGMGPFISAGLYGYTEKTYYTHTWGTTLINNSLFDFDAFSILSLGFKI